MGTFLEIFAMLISFTLCISCGIYIYNSMRTIQNNRRRQEDLKITEMMSSIQGRQGANPEETGVTGTSTGTADVVGVAGVQPVTRVRMSTRSVATPPPKYKPGNRYDLLKKVGKGAKSLTKRKNRYDLLKNKE